MNLPVILIGGGLLYFIINKNSSKPKVLNSQNPSQNTNSNIIGSKKVGYVIQNCKLTIYDPDIAYEYAFQQGKELIKGGSFSTNKLKNTLLGDCFSTLEKRKCLLVSNDTAKFIYELIRYGYSGAYSEGAGTINAMMAMLKDIITQVKKEFKNINTDDWSNQLIEEGK